MIDSLAPEWGALCAEGRHNQPFYRPEWIAAYLRAFEPQARVVLIAPRRGGRLVGVLPLIEERIGVLGKGATRLRAPANVHSNRLDLIHGAGDGDAAIELIWRTLTDLLGWDILDFRDVPEDGAFLRLLALAERAGFATFSRETLRSPYVPLDAFTPSADILAPLDKEFRHQLRRRLRKLKSLGPVRVERVDRTDHEALDRFFALEQSGWKGQSGTAIACRPDTRQFYTEVSSAAGDRGYLVLHELWCGEQPVAIGLGMALDGRYFKIKSGMDERFRAVGPGHLLEAETMRDLVDRSFSEFDMLGHNDEFKAKWTPHYRQHYHCHVFRKGPVGRALQTWTERFLPVGRRIHRRIRGLDDGNRGRHRGTPEPTGPESS